MFRMYLKPELLCSCYPANEQEQTEPLDWQPEHEMWPLVQGL